MANEDIEYLKWLHDQPCCADGFGNCEGWIEAHHAGVRGLSQRAHDHTAIPLCKFHHECWHNASGVFKVWNKVQRRQWLDTQISKCMARYKESRD